MYVWSMTWHNNGKISQISDVKTCPQHWLKIQFGLEGSRASQFLWLGESLSSYGHWRHTWWWWGWVTADNVSMETREWWGHWGTLPLLSSCDQPPVVPGPASSFPRSRDSRQPPPASRPPLIPVSTQPRRSNTSSYFGTATISSSTSHLLKW